VFLVERLRRLRNHKNTSGALDILISEEISRRGISAVKI
jgi:hypothetical protein